MSMLDELGRQALNEGLSDKLDDNPEEDQALQTTARIATAHIWAFLAPASTLDDYGARRAAKVDEVNYICAGIAPHVASALANHVLRAFDSDFTAVWAQRQGGLVRRAQEEELGSLAGDLLSSVVEHGQSGSDGEADEPGLLSAPKVSARQYRIAVNDPSSSYELPPAVNPTLLPGSGEADPQNDDEHKAPQTGQVPSGSHGGLGLLETPKVDQELEDPYTYYGQYGAGGQLAQQQRSKESATRLGADVGYGTAAIPFDLLSPEEKTAHIGREHQADVQGMSALGSAALHQVLHDEAGLDVDHYHPRSDNKDWNFGPYQDTSTVVDRYGHLRQVPWARMDAYGHVRLGGYDRSRDPEAEEDFDPDGEIAEYENRGPENDVYEHPGEGGDWRGGVHERGPTNRVPDTWSSQGHVGQRHTADDEEFAWDDPEAQRTTETDEPAEEDTEAQFPKSQRWDRAAHSVAKGKKEKSTTREAQLVRSAAPRVPRPPAYEDMSPTARLDHLIDVHAPGPQWSVGWSMVNMADRDRRHANEHANGQADHAHQPPKSLSASHRQGSQRPPQGSRRGATPELGYAPEEVFPGVYGALEAPEMAPAALPVEDRATRQHRDAYHAGGDLADHEADHAAAVPPSHMTPHTHTYTHPEGYQFRTGKAMPRLVYDPATGQRHWTAPVPPGYLTGVTKRRPTAAADLTGGSNLPADPESDTGASGGFQAGNAENVMGPGGGESGNFAQSDEPQDIQAQLGQIPTLSHKIGAKVAEIAAEVLAHNPRLSAAEAMTLSLKTLRLWPRVVLSAERRVLPPLNGDDKPSYDHLTDDHGLDESKLSMGGTATTHSFEHENYDPEYFNHEHTAGLSRVAMGGADYLPEGEEVLEECPQCHREAYNRQVNRCHHCGFWDAGLEPLIEIT